MAAQIELGLNSDWENGPVQSKNATKGIEQLPGHSRLIGNCPRNGSSPFPEQACLIPETPHMSRRQRAEAFAAWVAAGKPWPPPAGLTSALIGAVMPKHRERRW